MYGQMTYIYIYIHIYKHTCIYIYIHIYIHTCVYIYIRMLSVWSISGWIVTTVCYVCMHIYIAELRIICRIHDANYSRDACFFMKFFLSVLRPENLRTLCVLFGKQMPLYMVKTLFWDTRRTKYILQKVFTK